MGLWSRECPVCADIGWCNDHPIKDHDDMSAKPNEPEALEPCPFCGSEAKIERSAISTVQVRCAECVCGTGLYAGDKIGRRNAIAAWNRRVPAQPVADAGGVTEGDVIGLINIVTDLAEVDALDKAYPEVWGRLDAMVNHAVAAATAPKDARDPLRDIVFRYIDRMNDVAPECGDPADRILGDFARDVNAVLKAERAALSEAREAGALADNSAPS